MIHETIFGPELIQDLLYIKNKLNEITRKLDDVQKKLDAPQSSPTALADVQ